jgi:hypothetical protein
MRAKCNLKAEKKKSLRILMCICTDNIKVDLKYMNIEAVDRIFVAEVTDH